MAQYQISTDYDGDQVYHDHSNERQANLSSLRQHLPDALQELQLGGRQTFKMLSIGAGDGLVDREIFNIVKEGYMNGGNPLENLRIEITAIEPHQAYEAQYNQQFEIPLRQNSVAVEFRPETFESYMETSVQYELIEAIHSLYFVRPLEDALIHCYEHLLGDKGLIVCLHAGEDCIYNKVREGLNINRHDQTERTRLRHAERIAALAEEKGWNFSQFPCPITIDVTGIVSQPPTEVGRMLLDFVTKEKNFFGNAHQESVGAVLEKLKEISREDGNRKVVNETNQLFLIYKSP